mmetsp:Transcript_40863/g.131873  ORF Transcript_40863/g.131873 Transcript_40863/m.131873 type:complete len:217 (-) Transcript_40863:610-1260(-)
MRPLLSFSHPPHVFAQRWCLTRSCSQAPASSSSEQLEAAGRPTRSTSEEMISTGESAQISAGSSSNRSPAGSVEKSALRPWLLHSLLFHSLQTSRWRHMRSQMQYSSLLHVVAISSKHSHSEASGSSEVGSVQSSSESLRGEVSGLSRRLSVAAASATSAFSTSSSSSDPLTCSAPQSTEEAHKKALSRTAPVAGSMSFSVATRPLIMIARLGSRV